MTDSRVPFLLGLTGSIGMGKSTVSGMFRDEGVPVFCADEVVHRLYSEGGAAVLPLAEAFPGAVISGAVDRRQLSQAVMGNQEALRRLEDIVHPLVHEDRRRWLKEHQHHSLLLLDIPLLFETDGAGMVDVVAVVSASAEVQRSRVLARPGMTQETLDAILARQTPDEEKRRRASFVFNTNETLAETQERVRALLKGLKGRKGFAFNQHMKDL